MSSNKNRYTPESEPGRQVSQTPGEETMEILFSGKWKKYWEKKDELDFIDMDADSPEEPENARNAIEFIAENENDAKEDFPPNEAVAEMDFSEGEDSAEEAFTKDEEDFTQNIAGAEEDFAKNEDDAKADIAEDEMDIAKDEDEAEIDITETEEDFVKDEDQTERSNKKHNETKKTGMPRRNPKGNNGMRVNFHIILLAAIFLIAITAVYRLYRWNQGTPEADIDTEDIDPSQFDIETLDMILPMDASLLEGREDDGELTILCLGNNPFTDDRSDTGLASLIAQKTNATVYDCAFPDSTVACRNATYSPDFPRDHFNLYYTVEWLRSGDFSAVSAIASLEINPKFTESVEAMKAIDMDKVDVIIMMYDSTDYNVGTPSDNPNNPYDVTAFTGGLRTAIRTIKETWPYIRIFVMSHTYAQHLDDDGVLHNGTITDLGNGTLNHYLVKESEAVMDCGVSFVDNYYGTINEDNYAQYMTDYMHYNDAGREKLAERIAYIINNRMGVVTSTTSSGN